MVNVSIPQAVIGAQGRSWCRSGCLPLPRTGRTAEQLAAFAYLRALAAPHRLRTVADDEGFPMMPGLYGSVEWAGENDGWLFAYTTGRLIRRRLLALSDVRPQQVGDDELRIRFPVARLPEVARLLRARRRRPPSSAVSLRRPAGGSYRASVAPQERA